MPKEKSIIYKIEDEKPKSYLIKRSPDLTRTGVLIKKNYLKKGYSESSVKLPPSLKLNIGDSIYVSETDYGIYAKGKVIEVNNTPEVFEKVEDILSFFSNRNEQNYCFDMMIKLKRAQDKNRSARLYYHEYFIDQVLLERVIPLEGKLLKLKKVQSAFSKIESHLIAHLENPNSETNIKISSTIPGALRQHLYSFFNKKHKISTWIDIDHFVPKSLGGPGNIIENLVPIGFSLNRYKSNSIPKGLFVVSNNYPELKLYVKNEFISEQHMFLRSSLSKENAKKLYQP